MTDAGEFGVLQEVATADLLVELRRRFDALVVAGWRNSGADLEQRFYDWKGGTAPCIGLCDILGERIRRRVAEQDEA